MTSSESINYHINTNFTFILFKLVYDTSRDEKNAHKCIDNVSIVDVESPNVVIIMDTDLFVPVKCANDEQRTVHFNLRGIFLWLFLIYEQLSTWVYIQ